MRASPQLGDESLVRPYLLLGDGHAALEFDDEIQLCGPSFPKELGLVEDGGQTRKVLLRGLVVDVAQFFRSLIAGHHAIVALHS